MTVVSFQIFGRTLFGCSCIETWDPISSQMRETGPRENPQYPQTTSNKVSEPSYLRSVEPQSLRL